MRKIMKQVGFMVGVVLGCIMGEGQAGELTIEGNLVVKTNLLVNGQLTSSTLVLTNLAISGEAAIQRAVIKHLPPQGDLSMGPYTNGVTGSGE